MTPDGTLCCVVYHQTTVQDCLIPLVVKLIDPFVAVFDAAVFVRRLRRLHYVILPHWKRMHLNSECAT